LDSENLVEDFRLIVGLILMLSEPSACESIAMPSDVDEEGKIIWEVLKVQLILNFKKMGPSQHVVFPLAFFGGEWW
jgi:hypothetical protein